MSKKLITRKCSQEESNWICDLARAGMSRACIASQVFGTMNNGKPSNASISRVDYILYWDGIGVTDYRNGRNSLGKVVLSAIRQGTNITSAIRTAASAQAALLRKVG